MSFDVISDYSKVNLTEIPEKILDMTNLKMLFLERNLLTRLPDDLFQKLPYLMWLDLRNNFLEELPTSVAHHQHLEHLLLTNNNIKKLPNELGLVPTLKALQVADNPLIYPSKMIIQEGTKSIKSYLKQQYEKGQSRNAEAKKKAKKETENEIKKRNDALEMQEEKLIKVYNEYSETCFDKNNNRTKSSTSKQNDIASHQKLKMGIPQTTNRSKTIVNVQKTLSDPQSLQPMLRVKKLEHPQPNKQDEPLKIIHSIDKSETKIRLKSYFNKTEVGRNLDRIPESSLKNGWMNKLRILLNDQERILQQERNLSALTSWRQKKPATPKTFYDSDFNSRRSDIPYATYPEYAKIPNREELTSQLQAFLHESDILGNSSVQTSKVNLDKLINDLVEQLKEMEITYSSTKSPKTEIEKAGQQIHTIVDIHRKLLKLRAVNEYL